MMIPAYYLEIFVGGLGLLLLLLEAFIPGKDKRWVAWAGVAGLLTVFALNFRAVGGTGGFWEYYTYAEGSFAGFYKGLALISTSLVLLMGIMYFPVIRSYTSERHGCAEFYVLPLFTCAGLMWAASACDLISIFLAIEVVTISFYVLVAYARRNTGALEAGVKYLILGALSTGFMVYGIAWLFGSTGTTNLEGMRQVLEGTEVNRGAVLFGLGLILVALGFKAGAFPFNLWIPDVYQGAPTPITAYLSVGSKAAGFIVLIRVIDPFLLSPRFSEPAILLLAGLAAVTLIYGSLGALPQTNLKRLLGFSSMSNAGFFLLALACTPLVSAVSTLAPANIVAFGLSVYLLMTMLAFFVVTEVRVATGGEDLKAYSGLAGRAPLMAFALLISMTALAGVPLTAGFFSKFFVLQLAIQSGAWVLLVIALISAAAGFYYYLKVVRQMYASVSETTDPIQSSLLFKGVAVVLIAGILIFGFMPKPLLNLQPDGATATAVEGG